MPALKSSPQGSQFSYPCRLLGHAWDPYKERDPLFSTTDWRISAHLKCLRCDMKRHDAFDPTGFLSRRKYEAPEGYRLTVEERPTTEHLRMWLTRRDRSWNTT